MLLQQYDKAIEFYQKCVSLYRQQNSLIDLANVYSSIAEVFFYQGDYPKAIEYYFKALHLDEQNKTHPQYNVNISNRYRNLANVYQTLENYPEALKYGHLALQLSTEVKHNLWMTSTTILIGNIRQKQQQYDSAQFYLQKGLQLASKAEIKSKQQESLVFSTKTIYQCFDYAQKALEVSQRMQTSEYEAWHLFSRIYLAQKNYTQALKYAQKPTQSPRKKVRLFCKNRLTF